jgi:acetyltransferase-like isoleucine patch superfamily enzyme
MAMGKALDEIGRRGAWRYGVGQLQLVVLRRTLLPPQARVSLLRAFGARIGRGSLVHPVLFSNLYRTGFRGLALGRECFIGEDCFLDLAGPITFGDQVTLAERVMLLTHQNVGYDDHPLQSAFPAKTDPIEIGSGTFVGVGAIVLAGVTIGPGSVVAAGAVVTRDVPASSVVAGVPAKVVASTAERPDRP